MKAVKVFAIRCNQCGDACYEEVKGEARFNWICRAEVPPKGYVSFPLLGAFSMGTVENRLVWEHREVADLICQAMILSQDGNRDNLEGKLQPYPGDNSSYVVREVDFPDDLVPGRFQG